MRFKKFFQQSKSKVRSRLLVLLLLFPTGVAFSQKPVELHQAFLDLQNDAVVMNLSAHPDDEDGSTLAYYRMKYGVKTYSILFTRGEGGQNEIGPELYEELGVLRTEETQEAGAILGAEVHFLNLTDFGYSKTATETLQKWGGSREVLRRLVYVIRKYKPDVLFTNHNTIGGHGHHQAVAITAIAAFDAAADSAAFPEQLRFEGVSVWQPKKLFFRNFGASDQTADVVNQIGETNPLRGLSYLDIAAEALTRHKTQGMDRADLRRFTRGLSLYRLMRANSIYGRDTTSFLGGMDVWRDPGLVPLKGGRELLSRLHGGMSRDSILEIASEVTRLKNRRILWSPVAQRVLAQWQEKLEALIAHTCGIRASWEFADTVVVPTQKVKSTFVLESDLCVLSELKCSFSIPQGWAVNENASSPVPTNGKFRKNFEVFIGDNATLTLPKTVAQYNPLESEQPVTLHAHVLVNGKPITLSCKPPFHVAPFQSLVVNPKVVWFSPEAVRSGKKFAFTLTNFAPRKSAGRISVQMPPGWLSQRASYVIPVEDSTATDKLLIQPPKDVQSGIYNLRIKSEYAWDDITAKIFDVKVEKNIKLGIIKSYDTTLERAAEELGLDCRLLLASDLEGDLSRYSTVIIDIRAYLVREDLRKNNRRLLDYVRNGGHVIVMYHKDQEWNPEYAPYPITLSRRRVTVEEAPVQILQPEHPVFHHPNKITESDWEGWIQERGVYFPDAVAPEYTHLLSSNDPDEPPLTTGYLLAEYGKGSYIYTSYVWYRQLKEYNAGAFRSFMNMIAYPKYRSAP